MSAAEWGMLPIPKKLVQQGVSGTSYGASMAEPAIY